MKKKKNTTRVALTSQPSPSSPCLWKQRDLVVLATAILNKNPNPLSPKEIKRLTKDILNRAGLDWDKENNRVILKSAF